MPLHEYLRQGFKFFSGDGQPDFTNEAEINFTTSLAVAENSTEENSKKTYRPCPKILNAGCATNLLCYRR